MPLLKVNLDGSPPLCGTRAALKMSLACLPKGAPVIICIHGYRYSPFEEDHDPHRHILALNPPPENWKTVSWPRALGFGTEQLNEGLCVNIGWQARGSIWKAHEEARRVGESLARLIWDIDRPVNIIGHSLGARVALSAIAQLPYGTVSRVILLAAAEFRSTAEAVLNSEAGTGAEFINVTSRENDLYDALAKLSLRADYGRSSMLGSGLGRACPNWCDLPIDDDYTRHALARLGHDIPAPQKRVCHWSPYLRTGLFNLYRSAFRQPDQLPLALLNQLVSPTPAPRFAMQVPQRRRRFPMPYSRNASS